MTKVFTEPLKELENFEELKKSISCKGITDIEGPIDVERPHFVMSVTDPEKTKLVIVSDDTKATEFLQDMRLYDRNAVYYPPRDLIFYQSDLNGNKLTKDRINCIKILTENAGTTVVTTFDALMEKIPGIGRIRESIIHIDEETEIDTEALSKELIRIGYRKSVQCEEEGEFAVRGGIIDIFPLTEDNPVRIELWGDVIDSIRAFDAATQRSIEKLEEVNIFPASETIRTQCS